MKLVVLVPSDAYRAFAGARIRYDRIAPELDCHGVELELVDIGKFDVETADCDGIIISKCHDARALVAAAELGRRGKLVGVDLFDDYFSQASDSRLIRYRNWLAQLLPLCGFALCSTEAMADIVAQYRSALPTHVMNDPAPSESFAEASASADRKLADARDSRQIRLCWFGVGDNPYFPVGLADLASYANVLPALSRTGFDVRLKVVTNERALSADGLSMLARLPIRTEIEQWTEQAEQDALQDAFAAFIPVSAQRFSVGKSLNRAVTALSAGCQVLSVGYPLYEALDPLIYRDPPALLEDIERGEMRFSAGSQANYRPVFESCASADAEARELARFLKSLAPQALDGGGALCLIHGHSTRLEAHSFVRQANGLSVASPYCSAPFDFDVVFRGGPSGLTMLVSKSAEPRLLPQVRGRTKPGERIKGRPYVQISRSGGANGEALQDGHWERAPIPFQLATYRESLSQVERALADAFGPCRTFICETRPVPFPLPEQVS